MNLVFATDNNYAEATAVAVASVLICNQGEKFSFYILTDRLDDKKRRIIENVVNNFSKESSINFIYLTKELTQKFVPTIKKNNHVSLATYYRIFIPSLLPDVHKVLYLDGDIICVDKLRAFYETDLSDFSMAGAHDERTADPEVFTRLDYPLKNGYVAAGVLLINLDYWRKHSIQEKAAEYISSFPEKCVWHDQDALNKVLNGTIKFVHIKYNVYEQIYTGTSKYPAELKQEADEGSFNPVILHFSDMRKPWQAESKSPFRYTWRKLYKKVFFKKCILSHKYKGKIRVLWTVKKVLNFTGIKRYAEFRKYPEYEQLKKEIEKKLF